jgi:hypothetical protein
MKINDLKKRIIAVYAGRFHPFHRGHAQAFRELQGKFGADDTYIATSGKVEPGKSPFSFEEKRDMILAALPGLDAARVFEEPVPYAPVRLPATLGLDPNQDVLVFAVGAKDMAADPRFTFQPLKDGTASYFQPFAGNQKDLQPFSSAKNPDGSRAGHGYIYPVQDYKFTVAGKPSGSASEIRAQFSQADDEIKKRIIADLYPDADANTQSRILSIFNKRLQA